MYSSNAAKDCHQQASKGQKEPHLLLLTAPASRGTRFCRRRALGGAPNRQGNPLPPMVSQGPAATRQFARPSGARQAGGSYAAIKALEACLTDQADRLSGNQPLALPAATSSMPAMVITTLSLLYGPTSLPANIDHAENIVKLNDSRLMEGTPSSSACSARPNPGRKPALLQCRGLCFGSTYCHALHCSCSNREYPR